MRRKQPCIVVDPEEAENAARLVQHFAARRFAGEDVDESELWSTPDDEETEPVAATSAADGAGDDSGNGLAIGGLVAGVAGLLVGGVALARSRKTA